MGLDMYAYSVDKNGEEDQLADWRKHNRLHGWMEELWEDKGKPYEGNLDDVEGSFGSQFNCIPLELTFEDLKDLQDVINRKVMPETGGFFFGDDSFDWDEDDNGNKLPKGDYYYKQTDVQFVRDACQAIRDGKKVYYNSWW